MTLDSEIPRRGECLICKCGYDARHRLMDAIREEWEYPDVVAEDFGIPVELVRKIRAMSEDDYRAAVRIALDHEAAVRLA